MKKSGARITCNVVFHVKRLNKDCKNEDHEPAMIGKSHWWKEPLYHLLIDLAKWNRPDGTEHEQVPFARIGTT